MARKHDNIDLEALSRKIREARERKGLTLEELSHELWQSGFPTSQNKLWRMENKPPKRLDSELLLWLERKLDVSLVDSENQNQVLIHDVVELLDSFLDKKEDRPQRPANPGMGEIYDRVAKLAKR